MVYRGLNSYAYIGAESGGFKLGVPATDTHIPLNRVGSQPLPNLKYVTEFGYSYSSLDPVDAWNEELSEGSFEVSDARYNSPFLLQFMFGVRTVGGVWGTGTGTLAFNNSALTDAITLFLQSRLADNLSTNHIDRVFTGINLTEYSWTIEMGQLVKENASGIVANRASGTQAMSCNNNFHDQAFGSGVGGFSNWSTKDNGNRRPYHATECTITWGGSAFSGIDIVSGDFKILTPHSQEKDYSSFTPVDYWKEARPPVEGSVTGRTTNKTLIEEAEKAYTAKTPATYKVQLGTTTYQALQITNAIIEDFEALEIPEVGKPWEVSLKVKSTPSSALSYAGSFLNHADPTTLIYNAP